jgi:sulfite exporter TauE/SafE
MLASITPLGERGRGGWWPRTVVAYVVGSAAGGALTGALLGLVGAGLDGLPSTGVLAVAAVAAVVAALLDATGRTPTIRRQVDETWLVTYRDWVYGSGFGFQLGVGALTIVTSATVYLAWLFEVLSGSVVAGAGIGLVFGVTRALPLLSFAGVTSPEQLRARHRTLARLSPIARGVSVGSSLLVAGVASVLVMS